MNHNEEFKGKIGKTVYESEPWWPSGNLPEGKPNIILIVLDDTGYSHFGCYGSTIETPTIDKLAADGLRYTNFHTTALCSPTRASLLTGRNHHSVGMRGVSNMDTGFPNMRGYLPRNAATMAEVLRDSGYATFVTGKWHLTPMSECTAAGPFHNWPLQRGFNRFYGFMQGETDQFYPELTCDNHHIDAPGLPADGYHVSEDTIDQSIKMIRDQLSLVPERPFFSYIAFGATHSPHQAPASYMEKYRGRFDAGWDEVREQWYRRQLELGVIPENTQLAPRNPGVRPWNDLSENEQRFACRLQEAFAAQLDHTDAQIGRLVDFLREVGQLDDTLLIVMSDNGASQEGGPTGVLDEMRWFNGLTENVDEAVERIDDIGGPESHSNIPWGWAQAGNTPLKWYKQNTHGGGVRDPLVIHWPRRLKAAGELRRTFCHAIDLMPTLLELTEVAAPDTYAGISQMPLHGVSLVPTFDSNEAGTGRSTQYFEMLGHRGIWKAGWKAVTRHVAGQSWDDDEWELYHLDKDFSESNNLASTEPARLKEMLDLWWSEAEQYGVLPLDDRSPAQTFRVSRRPGLPVGREVYVYYPPISHVVADACPSAARGWTMVVELTHPENGGDGMLVNRGTLNSGFALYVHKGAVCFNYNSLHKHSFAAAKTSLDHGDHQVTVKVERTVARNASIIVLVDDEQVATGTIDLLLGMLSSAGMDIGRAAAPVNKAYDPPFAYPGTIHKVTFTLPPRQSEKERKDEAEREARAAMTRQ